jgi:hypothetical protein
MSPATRQEIAITHCFFFIGHSSIVKKIPSGSNPELLIIIFENSISALCDFIQKKRVAVKDVWKKPTRTSLIDKNVENIKILVDFCFFEK